MVLGHILLVSKSLCSGPSITNKTDDFQSLETGKKSVPLNIVIKLSSANGNPAVKLSDDLGKNTGDSATVRKVKEVFGYVDKHWEGAEEKSRWGQ